MWRFQDGPSANTPISRRILVLQRVFQSFHPVISIDSNHLYDKCPFVPNLSFTRTLRNVLLSQENRLFISTNWFFQKKRPNSIKLTFSFPPFVTVKRLWLYCCLLFNGSKLIIGCAKRGYIWKNQVLIARLYKVKSRLINLTVWMLNFLNVKTFKCWILNAKTCLITLH